MSTTTAPPPLTWHSEDVDVTTLEGQIVDMWRELKGSGKDNRAVRTHIFNLVVYTRERQHAAEIERGLFDLTQLHPSRTIILASNRSREESVVEADVAVQCVPPRDDMPAYCFERITLHVHGRAADHLSNIVVPLLLPDLPTYLWWPGQPQFGHRLFHRLLTTADQLVVDSAQFDSPGDGFANLARLCSGKQGVNDFNWVRLAPWRELIAQFFDGPDMAPYASGIRSIEIEFGRAEAGHPRATASILLILGWMGTNLGWEPETTLDSLLSHNISLAVLQGQRLIPIEVHVFDHGPRAAGRFMRLRIEAEAPGRQPARFTIRRSDTLEHVHVAVEVGGEEVSRVLPVSIPTDAELLAGELERADRDSIYRSVVDLASRLAGREVWMPQ